MNPEEWLADFESKIADVQAKTAQFQEDLESAGATESAKDGSIRVTVAANGALTGLQLTDAAGSGPVLAQEILKLARKAQRAAAVRVAEAFAPLGADSEAMRMVTGYIPPEEPEDEPDAPAPTYRFVEETEPPVSQPRPTQEPQSRPARHRRPDDEDDDFGDNSYLRRD
jgi:DNA-binding protein YbaB